MTSRIPEDKILIQFDGMCILCSKTVMRILKADRKKRFIFQSIHESNNKPGPNTVVVIEKDIVFQHFEAILKIGKELGGIYRILNIFRILPQSRRTKLYLWIAKNRYKWFGYREYCFLPLPEDKDRFI